MERLTERQEAIFGYLKNEIRRKGYPPTVREICDAVSLCSTSTVHSHLEALEKKGYIKRSPTKNRSIEILEDNFYSYDREHVNVPVISRVRQDAPLLAVENVEEVFPVPPAYIPAGSGGDLFMLRLARGAQAAGDFREGDLLLVDRSGKAGAGDLVVMCAEDGKVSAARLEKRQKKAGADADGVLGKVIGMYRKY